MQLPCSVLHSIDLVCAITNCNGLFRVSALRATPIRDDLHNLRLASQVNASINSMSGPTTKAALLRIAKWPDSNTDVGQSIALA
jgi:hypothetical protein